MKSLFLLFCLFTSFAALAQIPPDIRWQTTIGCSNVTICNNFLVDRQGNYVIAGESYDSCDVTGHSYFWGDGWVIKTDTSGNRLWSVVVGADSLDELFKIIQTADNGYVAVGRTQGPIGTDTTHGQTDAWIVKLDSNGNVLWQRALGGPGYDDANDVAETDNGDIVIAGSTSATGGDVGTYHGGLFDAWIIRLNNTGNVLWSKTFGSSGTDFPCAMTRSGNNTFVFTGTACVADGDVPYIHSTSYPSDVWTWAIDDTGRVIWSKTYGGSMNQNGWKILKTNDGGFLIGAASSSSDMQVGGNYGADDMWAVKIDDTGKIQWQKHYGGSLYDGFSSITQCKEGGYLFAGASQSIDYDAVGNHGAADMLLIKTDDTGAIVWKRMFGGLSGEAAPNVWQNDDTTYIVGGITNSHNGDVMPHVGSTVTWIFKLGPYSVNEVSNVAVSRQVKVFPTITDGVVNIVVSPGTAPQITVLDVTGRTLLFPVTMLTDKYIFSLAGYPTGMYLCRVICGADQQTFKIILR